MNSARRIICLAALFVAATTAAYTQPTYTITRVRYTTQDSSDASAINDSGLVVGGSFFGSTSAGQWQNGTGSLVANNTLTNAFGVNASGQIVGYMGAFQAYVAQNHVATILGAPTGSTFAIANAINNSGVIVGRGRVNSGQNDQAWIYQNGGFTQLGFLSSNPNDNISSANAINNNGLAVGYARETINNNPNNSWVRPVTFQNGVITNLMPNAMENGRADAVNDNGQIVGTFAGNATLWQNGTSTNLGVGNAHGININGDVVGDAVNSQGVSLPFIYTGGIRYDLTSLITNATGWNIKTAFAINASGQIVGSGTFNRENTAYILTPGVAATATPEPGSLALLAGLGVSGCVFGVRRRLRK